MTSQQQIITITRNNDRDIKWLAQQIGEDYDVLYYQLNRCDKKNFRKDIHDKCMQVFIKEGWVKDPVTNLKELQLTVHQLQMELARVQEQISERALFVSADGKYDFEEEQQTKVFAINWKNKINNCFDKFIS